MESMVSFALVFGASLTIGAYVISEAIKKNASNKVNSKIITPLRLQAYERMILFLERISPNNIVVRLAPQANDALEFQQTMLRDIREEFNHNLSQQVYIKAENWEKTKMAMNEVVSLINTSSGEVSADAPALELSKKILENVIKNNLSPTEVAILGIKQEAQELF